MHIAILQVLHPPFDKRVFYKEARSLVEAGHQVTSITPHEGPLEARDGVDFIPTRPAESLLQRLIATFRLIPIARKVPAEVSFCMEPESWVAGLVLKLFTGRKVVFDVHEYIPTEFAKFFPRPLQGLVAWVTIRAMRLFARYTDHIILTKACLDRDFKGLKTPRTVVLNTNHLQPLCAEIPEALQTRYAGKPTVIHQGIFGDTRGAYQLLDALVITQKTLPDLKCILLGKYVYGDEGAFRAAIEAKGLSEVVDMIDEVPFEDVPPYIAVARLGLILFQPYGLGNTLGMPHKMFDYMREATPYIAPDYVIEVKRVVEESDCALLVDVTNPEAIAEAMIRLLSDSELANRLGENGRKSVETTYNWQQDEAALLRVFATLGDQ